MDNKYDIIIVGAGPVGLIAAIYACRVKKSVLVFYGGQIVSTHDIENYPVEEHISSFDFATKLYNQTKNLGAEIKFEKVVEIKDGSVKEVVTTKNVYKCKTIILATGAENRKLGLPNEDVLIDKLNEKKSIKCIFNSNVTKLIADEKLSSIEVSGEDVSNISVDGIFISVGRVPENQNFAKLINLNDFGYFIASEDCNTNVPGIFVAGDNRTELLRQHVTATGDGAVAATEAIKYING